MRKGNSNSLGHSNEIFQVWSTEPAQFSEPVMAQQNHACAMEDLSASFEFFKFNTDDFPHQNHCFKYYFAETQYF